MLQRTHEVRLTTSPKGVVGILAMHPVSFRDMLPLIDDVHRSTFQQSSGMLETLFLAIAEIFCAPQIFDVGSKSAGQAVLHIRPIRGEEQAVLTFFVACRTFRGWASFQAQSHLHSERRSLQAWSSHLNSLLQIVLNRRHDFEATQCRSTDGVGGLGDS